MAWYNRSDRALNFDSDHMALQVERRLIASRLRDAVHESSDLQSLVSAINKIAFDLDGKRGDSGADL